MPRTWLVTGASGFLGQAAVRRLLSLGCRVRGLDVAPAPEASAAQARYEHVQGDVRDPEACRRACQGVKAVLHGAAALPILRDRKEIFSVNVDGTRNLLEASVAAGVGAFVFVSSTAVYGLHKVHPIHEDVRLVPVGPYGESKIEAERVCASFRDRLHVPIVRPKTFLGEGRLGVFEILFDWIHDGKRIPLLGQGHNRYQLLHVDDLLDILLLAARHPGGNDTFNAGADRFGTLRQDLAPLFAAAGHPTRFLPTPRRTAQAALWALDHLRLSPLTKWHYGTMASDSYVEVEKAARVLGWRPRRSNEQTLLDAYTWYHANRAAVRRDQAGTTHTVPWDQKALRLLKKVA